MNDVISNNHPLITVSDDYTIFIRFQETAQPTPPLSQ